MLGLEKIVAGAKVRGWPVPCPSMSCARVDARNWSTLGTDGSAEVLLFRDAEPRLELVQATRAFSFDGDGEAFQIASEAQRIRLAEFPPTACGPDRALNSAVAVAGPSCVLAGGSAWRRAFG